VCRWMGKAWIGESILTLKGRIGLGKVCQLDN